MEDDQAPEGYEYVWVPEESLTGALEWRTFLESEAKQCRHTEGGVRCIGKSVAKLNRSSNPHFEQWWHCCERHMFGRRIGESGEIETRILREKSDYADE